MGIHFNQNERPTIGVELELHVIDGETGDLVSAATDILTELGTGHPDGEHPKAKHELFQSTIEIITGICETAREARLDLQATLDEVNEQATKRGLRLLSSGTHPFGLVRKQDISPNPRYFDLIDSMQWTARRLLICGMHVHVGVHDGQRAITIINELRRHLPIFLALSASSPFFEGEDSGLDSARSKVFEALPTAGLPPQILDWEDFEDFMSTLIDSDCIQSIREVWWDVRPHPDFGTIEFRMCDATHTLREASALAALAQCLVAWCNDRIDDETLPDAPNEWVVKENRWFAARYGMDAKLIVERSRNLETLDAPLRRPIRELVHELVDRLAPYARVLDCEDEMKVIRDIAENGNGADLQRRLVNEGRTLPEIVHHLADQLMEERI